jgi:hypothetical protein
VLVHASSFGSQALSGWQTVIGVTGWAKNGLSNDQPRVQGLPAPEAAGGSPRRGQAEKKTAGQAKSPDQGPTQSTVAAKGRSHPVQFVHFTEADGKAALRMDT